MFQKRVRIIVAWLLVLLWMSLIFYLSHQPATKSSELSSGIVEVVVQTLDTLIPFVDLNLESLHIIIRKGAHLTAYFVLGSFVMIALKQSGLRHYRLIVLSLVICVLYAISDEIHQLFIPGRSGEIKDVLIDSSGATGGILFFLLVNKLFYHREH